MKDSKNFKNFQKIRQTNFGGVGVQYSKQEFSIKKNINFPTPLKIKKLNKFFGSFKGQD